MKTRDAEPFTLDPDDFGMEVQVVDWKQCSDEALEAFDYLLSSHGLELVKFETGGDAFVFGIEKRSE